MYTDIFVMLYCIIALSDNIIDINENRRSEFLISIFQI